MLNIMTCEDNLQDARQLERALRSCDTLRDIEYRIESFGTARQLLLNFCASECDLLFLDILMDGANGIELARQIRERDADVPIVFITSSRDYAVDSYGVDAAYYLLKPATPSSVDMALARCQRTILGQRRSIEITSGRVKERVFTRDIIYVESFGNRARIHLRDRDINAVMPLSRIVEECGRSFLRCHRSYVVNMDYVARTQGKTFVMANGVEVPIRSNGASQTIEAYHAYLFESVRKS